MLQSHSGIALNDSERALKRYKMHRISVCVFVCVCGFHGKKKRKSEIVDSWVGYAGGEGKSSRVKQVAEDFTRPLAAA